MVNFAKYSVNRVFGPSDFLRWSKEARECYTGTNQLVVPFIVFKNKVYHWKNIYVDFGNMLTYLEVVAK